MADDDPTCHLRALRPVAISLDAAALAYEAGRRSARAETWRWRGVTAAVTLLLAVWATAGRQRPESAAAPAATRVAGGGPGAIPETAPSAEPIARAASGMVDVSRTDFNEADLGTADPTSVAALQQLVGRYGLAGLPRASSPSLALVLRAYDRLPEGR